MLLKSGQVLVASWVAFYGFSIAAIASSVLYVDARVQGTLYSCSVFIQLGIFGVGEANANLKAKAYRLVFDRDRSRDSDWEYGYKPNFVGNEKQAFKGTKIRGIALLGCSFVFIASMCFVFLLFHVMFTTPHLLAKIGVGVVLFLFTVLYAFLYPCFSYVFGYYDDYDWVDVEARRALSEQHGNREKWRPPPPVYRSKSPYLTEWERNNKKRAEEERMAQLAARQPSNDDEDEAQRKREEQARQEEGRRIRERQREAAERAERAAWAQQEAWTRWNYEMREAGHNVV